MSLKLSSKKKAQIDGIPRRTSVFPEGRALEVSAKEKNKVQDRIKRRLSTKIGHPTLISASKGSSQAISHANRIQIPREQAVTPKSKTTRPTYDPAVFNDPKFDADSYVKKMLSTATPAELDDFFHALQESKTSTNASLQKNVFRNYREFIMISKEIGTIETDMATIRGLLNDLRGLTSTLKDVPDFEENARPTSRPRGRNSIIDFHALNKNHLKALWTQVEGAQKFLPADEGRRIVRESGAWSELNAHTWRPKNKVHIVLLNDHLLIAQKRPKPSGSGQKLIAQRCLPLSDIKMREFKDDDMQDAISIRVATGREKYVFRADTADEKKAMFLAFGREAAELQASQQQNDDNTKRLTGSHTASREVQIKRLSRRLSKTPGLQRNGSISFGGDGEESIDLAWIQERMDDLDQRIAHREYASAVRSIFKGRALVASAGAEDLTAELTSLRLDERAERLASMVSLELADESSKTRIVKELVSYLVGVGYTDLARETFLNARSELIKKLTKGVLFEGEISLYISDLALVHFTLIKNTAQIYTHAFTAPQEASGLVAWSKLEVESFADLFNRQLYGVDRKSAIYKESLEAVSKQIAVLRDVGLDLSFVAQEALNSSHENGWKSQQLHSLDRVGRHLKVEA